MFSTFNRNVNAYYILFIYYICVRYTFSIRFNLRSCIFVSFLSKFVITVIFKYTYQQLLIYFLHFHFGNFQLLLGRISQGILQVRLDLNAFVHGPPERHHRQDISIRALAFCFRKLKLHWYVLYWVLIIKGGKLLVNFLPDLFFRLTEMQNFRVKCIVMYRWPFPLGRV